MRWMALSTILIITACRVDASAENESANAVAQPVEPHPLSALERSSQSLLRKARSEQQVEGLEARARSAFEDDLFDPFSARFRNLRSGRGGAICGQVNARNRMGAYVGFKAFVVGRDGRTTYTSASSDGIRTEWYSSFADAYLNACANAREAREYRSNTAPYYDDYSMNTTGDYYTNGM